MVQNYRELSYHNFSLRFISFLIKKTTENVENMLQHESAKGCIFFMQKLDSFIIFYSGYRIIFFRTPH